MPRTELLCDHPALQRHWYAVARSADLAREPVGVTLLGRDYVVWRDGDAAVVAAPDRCPQRETSERAVDCNRQTERSSARWRRRS